MNARCTSKYVVRLTQTLLAMLRMRGQIQRCTFTLDASAEPSRIEVEIDCEQGT